MILQKSRWDSAVGLATCHRLEGTDPYQGVSEAQPASCTVGNGSFLGVERPRCSVKHPPYYKAEVKERVQLYFNAHSPAWHITEHPLPQATRSGPSAVYQQYACLRSRKDCIQTLKSLAPNNPRKYLFTSYVRVYTASSYQYDRCVTK